MKPRFLKALKLTAPALALAALCGCGSPYTFSPYVGAQQNWQTGSGGYVKMVHNAMLYGPGQYPDRPYIIVGAVTTDNEDNLAKAVREEHADAALISTESSYHNGSVAVVGGGVVWAQPLRKTVITANLIRFKS